MDILKEMYSSFLEIKTAITMKLAVGYSDTTTLYCSLVPSNIKYYPLI